MHFTPKPIISNGGVAIVRHFKSEANHGNYLSGILDVPLLKPVDPIDFERAFVALQQFYSGVNPSLRETYASPLSRAIETGMMLNEKLAIPNTKLTQHPSLIERSMGELAGVRLDELPKVIQERRLAVELISFNPEVCPPNMLIGEGVQSFEEVWTVLDPFVQDIVIPATKANVRITCYCHGDTGDTLHAMLLGYPNAETYFEAFPHHVPNGNVHIILPEAA